MKLLLDENLSRRLVDKLADLFPGSTHVAFAGLLQSPDASIWEHAKAGGYTIVTADADFYELATTYGPPPKIIWLRGCDYPTAVAERLIRDQAVRLTEFWEDPVRAILDSDTVTPTPEIKKARPPGRASSSILSPASN